MTKILPNLISNIKRLLGMPFVIMRGLLTEKSAKRNFEQLKMQRMKKSN